MTRDAVALLEMIYEYITAATGYALQLREVSGQANLLRAVRSGMFPTKGTLPGGAEYSFHGVGCRIDFLGKSVDFDFGPDGRTDGFDAWRLHVYAEQFERFGAFLEEEFVSSVLSELEEGGMVSNPRWAPSEHLYYLTDRASSFGGQRAPYVG